MEIFLACFCNILCYVGEHLFHQFVLSEIRAEKIQPFFHRWQKKKFFSRKQKKWATRSKDVFCLRVDRHTVTKNWHDRQLLAVTFLSTIEKNSILFFLKTIKLCLTYHRDKNTLKNSKKNSRLINLITRNHGDYESDFFGTGQIRSQK